MPYVIIRYYYETIYGDQSQGQSNSEALYLVKDPSLGYMLVLDTTRKTYMGSLVRLLNLTQ